MARNFSERTSRNAPRLPAYTATGETAWTTTLQRLDRRIADAAIEYLQDIRRRGLIIDGRAWARELDRLSSGRPVDYSRAGLPLLYALRYMPKRVITLMGAFAFADPSPSAVLDIGTGTGATLMAAQMLLPSNVRLIGLDSSQEMLRFAAQTQRTQHSPAQVIEGTLEDVVDSGLPLAADFVTFSATLLRGFTEWGRLAQSLADAGVARVLAVEPESRVSLLDAFASALSDTTWEVSRSSTSALPRFMKADISLPGITRVWRQLGAPGSFRPQTWWDPPGASYLLATRT